MRNKTILILSLVFLVFSAMLLSGCQKEEGHKSPIQIIIKEWDPLVGHTYTTGTYDAQKVTISASYLSDYSPLSIDYVFIRKIKIEAEYNNTVIATYEFKTDFAVAINSESAIDDFPLNWPSLNTYLSGHGSISLINMDVTFSGEDSRGNAVSATSSVSVWVD